MGNCMPLQLGLKERCPCLPSGVVGQLSTLLAEPVFRHQGSPLLQLVPLLGVALDDICHAMPAECHHIAQLLAPACLHTGPVNQQ